MLYIKSVLAQEMTTGAGIYMWKRRSYSKKISSIGKLLDNSGKLSICFKTYCKM